MALGRGFVKPHSLSTFSSGGRDKLALVENLALKPAKDHSEQSFRLAKPDVKDWCLLCIGLICFAALLVQIFSFLTGAKLWSWVANLNLLFVLVQVFLRIDRFVNSRWSLEIDEGLASCKVKGVAKRTIPIAGSIIAEDKLIADARGNSDESVHLPGEWVEGQPLRLVTALELVKRGAYFAYLTPTVAERHQNPRVLEVRKVTEFNGDGLVVIVFGLFVSFLGGMAWPKSPDSWPLLAFGFLFFAIGTYITARNWQPDSSVSALAYRIDGSVLTERSDGQPDTELDLAAVKLTVQYWNGLTRHSLRIGWVDQKGTFRALTHWQDKITEDLSRIIAMAIDKGNVPEIVKWSEPK